MSDEAIAKITKYLDLIELELNRVAALTGHPSFEEFLKMKRKKMH